MSVKEDKRAWISSKVKDSTLHEFATKYKTRAKNRELRAKAYAVYLSSVPKLAPKTEQIAEKINYNKDENFRKPVGKISERTLKEMDMKRSYRPSISENSKNIINSKKGEEYMSCDVFSRSQKFVEKKEEWLERERSSKVTRELEACSFAPSFTLSTQFHTTMAPSLSLSDSMRTKGGGGGDNIVDRHTEWLRKRDQKLETERRRKQNSETDGCTFRPQTSYSHPKTKLSHSVKYKVDGGAGSSSAGKRQQVQHQHSVDDSGISYMNSSAHSSYSLLKQGHAPSVEIDYAAAAEALAWSSRRVPQQSDEAPARIVAQGDQGQRVPSDYSYRDVEYVNRYDMDEETFAREYESFLLSEVEAMEKLRQLRQSEGSGYDDEGQHRCGNPRSVHYEHIDDSPENDGDENRDNRHSFDDNNNNNSSSLTSSSGLERSNSRNEESVDLFHLARMDSGDAYGGGGRKRTSYDLL